MNQQFPHCDPRILHAPGECNYCDANPEWQELRKAWNIAFTGHSADLALGEYLAPKQPCPAEAARGLDNLERWGGNVPVKEPKESETSLLGEVLNLLKIFRRGPKAGGGPC